MKVHYLFTVLLLLAGITLSAQQTKLTLPSVQNQQRSSAFQLINLTGDSSVLGYLKISPESNDREAIVTHVDKER